MYENLVHHILRYVFILTNKVHNVVILGTIVIGQLHLSGYVVDCGS